MTSPLPRPRTLLSAWHRTLRANPGAAALVDDAAGRTWSRREIDAAAAAWAARHGRALHGSTVVFAEANGAGWLEVFLGLLQSGAVVAAVEPGEPAAAQRALAHAVGAAALWSEGRLDSLASHRQRRPPGARLLKLTSGSSGAPRVLAFTDAQLLADGRQVCATMGIRARDRNLGLIPFGHSYGLGNIVVPLLAQGTAVVCGVPPLPQAVAAAVARWRPTVFPSVPALLRALAETTADPAPWRSLRTVISAGAPLAAETAQKFYERFGRKIHNFYGSSETGGIAYDRSGEATLSGRSVGEPLEGVRLTWEGRGRFIVRSAAVFTLGNPRARRGRGAHRPADLARPDPAGRIVLLGRRGRMLKLAGRRLDPAEVERALEALPGVREARVAAHPRRSDALAAAVAGEIGADAALAALRARLAAWKIPRRLIVVPEFPRTPRGKIDPRGLRELLGGRE
jgi:acyl-CoA synthetase (AMP-forming)/AMP-acid ligase II